MPTPEEMAAWEKKRYDEFVDSFNYIQSMVYYNAYEHGWWDDERSVGDLISLIHTELSEAFEEFRNGHDVGEVYVTDANPNKPEGVGVELADAVIRIMDFAQYYGIDLATLILEKHQYNLTRPYKHGGKRL